MTRNHITLFLVGVALSIAQFIMIRDFVSILYGEEVVIVLVTASFFLGLSAGYVLALRLSQRAFQILLAVSILLHLTFPFSYRYIASLLSYGDVDGYWFLVLLFVYALIFNMVFATFLPRLITLTEDAQKTETQRLQIYYGLELAGFMSGFLVVAFSWNHPFIYLMAPYWVILGAVLYLVLRKPVLTVAYGALALLVMVNLHQIDYHSTALLYEHKHHIRGARVLYSVNSPYQKVEVIQNRRGGRYLYLDGLQNLNSTDLEGLNFYIAQIPAELMQPGKTLLIGNGTLSSVSRVYPHSGEVTSVELDGGVLEAGRRHFTPPETLEGLEHWSLHVDDGKHFLRQSETRYDLVVVDVPSPLTIQEAYLHSVEFYQLVKEHLTEQGVLAVQLSGPLQKNNRTPARVTAALREVFPEVLYIYSDRADRGFAYASSSLPFNGQEVRKQAQSYEKSIKVVTPAAIDSYLAKAVPLSVNSMDLVLKRGWERFTDRYFDD
jgi:spermidine synthase